MRMLISGSCGFVMPLWSCSPSASPRAVKALAPSDLENQPPALADQISLDGNTITLDALELAQYDDESADRLTVDGVIRCTSGSTG